MLQYRKLPKMSISRMLASAMGSAISSCPMPTRTMRPPGSHARIAVCKARHSLNQLCELNGCCNEQMHV